MSGFESLVSIKALSRDQIENLLQRAEAFKAAARTGEQQAKSLQGKLMASCFFEPSTRTRLSFEAAAKRLGMEVIGFSEAGNTSAAKGESLADSLRVIERYADVIVLRHSQQGAARLAADLCTKPVINAGDGANQHPSQTLLDLLSIQETQQRLSDLNIAFVGDLRYSRTVHSLAQAFHAFGGRFYLVCPEALRLPSMYTDDWKRHRIRFSYHQSVAEIIDRVDVLYMTRWQTERTEHGAASYTPSQPTPWRLNLADLEGAKENLKILHPLPRRDEIALEVDETPHAYYFEQAENGVYVRQAILQAVLEGNA